jgi:hypothetical protein
MITMLINEKLIAVVLSLVGSVALGGVIGYDQTGAPTNPPVIEPVCVPDQPAIEEVGELEELPTIPIILIEPIPYPDNSTRLPPEPPIIEITGDDRDG